MKVPFSSLFCFLFFVSFHGFPKAGVGAVANVFGDLLERCVLGLHQLVSDAHTHGNELLAEAMPCVLQDKTFGVSLGNVQLLGKVSKVDVFIVIENEKFADKEIIILNFGDYKIFSVIVTAKQRNIKGNGAVIARELAKLDLSCEGLNKSHFYGIRAELLSLAIGLKSGVQQMLILICAAVHHRCRNGKNSGAVDRIGVVIDQKLCSPLSQHMHLSIVVLMQ